MRPILFAALLAAVAAAPASASTVPYRTDAELVALARRVIRGRVLDTAAERTPGGAVRTRTRLAVIEDFTGGTDRVITVYELGGVLPDGSGMFVPGSPSFARGEEVVLCLEPAGDGFRTVALGFSAFRVGAPTPGGARLTRMDGDLSVLGRLRGAEPARTLDAFRATAGTVTGVRARLVVGATEAAAMVAAVPVQAPFTLLGGGIRWQEADSAVAIQWYRNTLTPSPVEAGDTDTEIRTALRAWTDPTNASIELNFAGTRLIQPDPEPNAPFCNADNLGAGLITFGDPRDELPVGVLAIGGGCVSSDTHVVNGQAFRRFTHGFIVFNDSAALSGFTAPPNITRILEHEIGHGIGLGHTDQGEDNIMYPACCPAGMPVPPAIGPDDRAGLEFIYPPGAQTCTYTLSPQTTTIGPIGGEALIAVTPSRVSCAWTVTSNVPWIVPTEGTAGAGNGTVRLSVLPAFGGQAQRSGTLSIASATATVVQSADTDADTDGLPDAWETFFGLNPASATGSDGPSGDPDSDGVSNADERTAGSHPRGSVRRYLAEGAANAFFDTEVALFNSESARASVWLRIQPESGPEVALPVLIPPRTLRTVLAPIFKTLVPGSFAILVETDRVVVVDRTMRWGASGYGAHSESAVDAPSTTWYLAEGSTSGDFALFYLLQNPGNSPAQATVRFLRPAPQTPIERTYTVAPRARLTIPVDTVAPELANGDVSGVITATQPIIVERAMYLSRPGQPFAAGHESAGVTAPSMEWFLAEGATGTFFDLFVLIENPGVTDAQVEVQYLLPSGGNLVMTKQYLVRAESRFTIYVDNEEVPAGSGQRPLASTAVAMRVRALNGVPIIVERAMWWPQPAWYEAHNAPATTMTGSEWAMAGGITGGPKGAETYVLIANTAAVPRIVSVSLHFEEDEPPLSTSLTVPPQSRTNVPIGVTFPQAAGRRIAILVGQVGLGLGVPGEIVVERATYESPGGVTWAAGTAAVATRITP